MDEALITGIVTVLVPAVVTVVVQYLKSKDTDRHGDAFINTLEGVQDSMYAVAGVLPNVKPAVDGYVRAVSKMKEIWNLPGFTAKDVQFAQLEAEFWKSQFDQALEAYRKLKAPA